ncbi:MAG: D-alanyl-D-alanine carboxypeptidase family protein [Butyrivibrio sp.]
MKRLLSFFLAITSVLFICTVKVSADGPELMAPSAILIEATTGRIIYEKNADEVLRPASITKIMTLILIYDALENNQISLSDEVTVSEYAASMGGSQVFLEAGEKQTVETMIKCIAIASANDACVAMAEHIWGSEGVFVEKMNERAKGLGMTNTHFVNCCGLDADGHVTTARDVSLMSRELIICYPQIHDYSTIWMDTITHVTRRGSSDFTLTNTNKLIKQYEWATGLKTGSTSLAGFCLSASACKNNIQLISVVMASPSGKTRVSDSIALLNYGYGICSLYKDNDMPKLSPVPVSRGSKEYADCRYSSEFSYLFLENYDSSLIEKNQEFLENIKAPINEGDTLGQLVYKYNGNLLGTVDIVASESIAKATLGSTLKTLWLQYLS